MNATAPWKQAIPIKFVRDTLIKSANRDLVLAAAAAVSVTTDRLHSQVVARRFNDQPGWNLQGYAIPLLFPQAGELPWKLLPTCGVTGTWPGSVRS